MKKEYDSYIKKERIIDQALKTSEQEIQEFQNK